MTIARFVIGDTRDVVASLPDNSVDLDERNADLARERIGMFLEVEEFNGTPAWSK